jgi:hypothetical protein
VLQGCYKGGMALPLSRKTNCNLANMTPTCVGVASEVGLCMCYCLLCCGGRGGGIRWGREDYGLRKHARSHACVFVFVCRPLSRPLP